MFILLSKVKEEGQNIIDDNGEKSNDGDSSGSSSTSSEGESVVEAPK